MARKRGASKHGLVLTDSGRPSECTAREFTVSAKISNEVFESVLHCSGGSNRGQIDSAAVCRLSGSKRGDSPFAVPLRPGSASQSLGQPFSMSSEPVFPHHPGVMHPLIQEHEGCAVGSGIEFSNRHELATSYTAFSSDLGSWPHLWARGEDTGLASKNSSKRVGATVGLGVGVGVASGVGGWGWGGADTGPASTDSYIPGPLALERWGYI
jgi:hypothetical protein